MKNLIGIFILLFIVIGCNQSKQVIKPFPKMEEFKSFETHSYGDERWDDCEEVYYVTYGITHDGDTLMVRKKHKYNCGTYDYTNWTD